MAMESVAIDELFERRQEYPHPDFRRRYASLVGIDGAKTALIKTVGICIDRSGVTEWWSKQHGKAGKLLGAVIDRPPLVILAGDVGTGKTALAESIGDEVARMHNIGITLFPLSLASRGVGRVGEMTRLISAAFDIALQEAEKKTGKNGKPSGGVILLVDEADALAQSRELAQMHHEDRAGVNAFIRGVDRVAQAHAPMAVIMCTNRLSAIDPAIRRRAAEVIEFSRPNATQRKAALSPLEDAGFNDEQITKLAEVTGENGKGYGATYSDIVQRFIPAVVMDAYPDSSVQFERALDIAMQMQPTPPFQQDK